MDLPRHEGMTYFMTEQTMNRTRSLAAYALGSGLLANAGAMLLVPDTWYQTVPTVTLTGPLNTHFIRDIGCAYALSGVGLIWAAACPRQAQAAAWLATLFLLMHAAVHLYEVAIGLCGWRTWWAAAPGVTLPALFALWITWPTAHHDAHRATNSKTHPKASVPRAHAIREV